MNIALKEYGMNLFKSVFLLITTSIKDDLRELNAPLLKSIKRSSRHRPTLIIEQHQMLSFVAEFGFYGLESSMLLLREGPLYLYVNQLVVFYCILRIGGSVLYFKVFHLE